MLRRTTFACTLLILGLVLATRAKADDLAFTYNFNGNTFTWQLPASPTPTDFTDGVFFDITNVPFSENGVLQATLGTFDFYNTAAEGGFDLTICDMAEPSCIILNAFGSQVYSGPESAPTFLIGTPVNLNNGTPEGPMGGLTTDVVTTPEPSGLLLLAGGLLSFIGLAWKRRLATQSIS
jgi:hypothetical protein